MFRRPLNILATAAVFLIPATAATSLPDRKQLYVSQYENVLGTSLDLKFQAASPAEAAAAETAILAEIDRQSKILSTWDPSSEVSRWLKTVKTPVPVSPDLFRVLSLFDQWRARTNGALDPAAEAVVRVWKSAADQNRVPAATELEAAVASVRQAHWSLDPSAHTATHLTATPLVLSSFTKSYIMDRALDAAFAAAPITAAVINIGGDIVVRGAHIERVEIVDPRSDSENGRRLSSLNIRDLAVATSGNYRRGVDVDGRHFSHIVDPRTGQPCDDILSSTVVARDPATAGALATAFSVMPVAESRRLAASLGNVEFLILAKDGIRAESDGWSSLVSDYDPAPAAADESWNGMELLVNVEVALINGPRIHRPYVAVWIEDENKATVRTVALWSEKPKYLTDMKAWYAADGANYSRSLAGATRPAGKYTIRWDGKDAKGAFVKPGKYTVCIEAAREHGTYQIIRQEMDFSGAPKQVELPGNTELASASLDYRKAR